MENFQAAVKNAIALYAETGGMTQTEALERFVESEECRQNIYLIVAMQATGGKYDAGAQA